ncbi:MAG: O-antigen ligase family protein [Actinobacteria bacterium]|nr:O-antigen ligase family protein [Actinomycetota bacterium]
MSAAGERFGGAGLLGAAAAAVLVLCALFFSGGDELSRLVWIGTLALAVAVLTGAASLAGLAPPVSVGPAGRWYLGLLLGLVAWMGLSTVWSTSPDRSWQMTNRTLVYAAFAVAGVVLGGWLPRRATSGVRAAALLLALVFGWALLAKCVPGLYPDYGRLSRLRAPLGYWNELALLGAASVPVALWIAAPPARRPSSRAGGATLLYLAVLVTLLTYSRVGIVLAAAAAVAWVALERERVEAIVAVVLGGAVAAGVFGVALSLPGITGDGEPSAVRSHDGWIFALAVIVGGALVFGIAWLLARRTVGEATRRAIVRAAAVLAALAVVAVVAASAARAHRIWGEFANPATSQISSGSGHALSLNSSNRWQWWQEEWRAFTEHPLLGTGAGTFQLTDQRFAQSYLVTAVEPHNSPLQFLGETGIVGFLLFLGAAAAATAGIVAARRRAFDAERAAVTALGLAAAVFLLHTVVDFDWSFVATCGPFLLVGGLLLAREPEPAPRPASRRLLAAAVVLVAAGGAYSLAAPWLAQRAIAGGHYTQARSYDPLSTDALSYLATDAEAFGNLRRATKLYRDEVALEPENGNTWWDLGDFYYRHGDVKDAYDALSQSWKWYPQGPAGKPCGELDQARHKVLGLWPPSCPRGSPRAATP